MSLGPVPSPVEGHLIAFEGLDQSGKQTQAERLAAALTARGKRVELLSFPDYNTAIGAEIGRALHGEREYAADVMQLLYIANRYEHRRHIASTIERGGIIVCDRYLASSIAYGEAQGLDPAWLTALQTYLPQPSLTVLLDIPPEASLKRKQTARDRYERDLQLLDRVRASYLRQASQPPPKTPQPPQPPKTRNTPNAAVWHVIDGTLDKDEVTGAVFNAVRTKLGLL